MKNPFSSKIIDLFNLFIKLLTHQFIRNVLVYTVSNILRVALPFLLLPFLTQYLTPQDYGIITTLEIILALSTILVGVNAHGAIGVNYFKLEKENFSVYVGTALRINGLITGAVFLIFLLIQFFAQAQLNEFPIQWLPLLAIISFMNVITSLTLTVWQVREKPVSYSLFQNLQTILNFALSIFLVVFLRWGWQGRLCGIAVSATLFAIIGLFLLYKNDYIKFSFDREHCRDILFFGLPLLPHALGGWIMTATDRFFITALIGISATGIYAVGYQIGSVMDLLAQSFNSAFSPFLFNVLKKDNPKSKIKIVQLTYLMFILIPILALIITFITPLILPHLIPTSYLQAQDYIKWILFAGAANWMYYMVVNYIFYAKRTRLLIFTVFFAAMINIVLNYILIKRNGAIGAAQATAVSYFLTFILTWILSIKVYSMPWNLWKNLGTK